VVAGVLALCCVATIYVNEEEAIRTEDDLSESDKQLIAAADDEDEPLPLKYSQPRSAQLRVAHRSDKKSPTVKESAEDQLSKDDEDLIRAANTVPTNAPWDRKLSHKKAKKVVKKAAKKAVKRVYTDSEEDDELSDDDQDLIHAADATPTGKPTWGQHFHKAKKVHAVPVKVQAQPEQMEETAQPEQMEETAVAKPHLAKKRVHFTSSKDDLDAEDADLIRAAANPHGKASQRWQAAGFHMHGQKRAMKKHVTEKHMPAAMNQLAVKEQPQHHLQRDMSVKTIQSQISTSINRHIKKQQQIRHMHFAKKPKHMMSAGEKKLRQTDDLLTPAEKKLIESANHEDPRKLQRARLQTRLEEPSLDMIEEKLATSHMKRAVPMRPAQPDKSVMKRAMEKITKRAAQKL
jgi:hypothetical protein